MSDPKAVLDSLAWVMDADSYPNGPWITCRALYRTLAAALRDREALMKAGQALLDATVEDHITIGHQKAMNDALIEATR